MELFPFINLIFTNPNEARKVSDIFKANHSFMINRFCSIEFPMQAAFLSHVKINPARLTDFWIEFLSTKYKGYNKPPKFFFTKTKKPKNILEKEISEVDINMYCDYYKIPYKTFKSAEQMFGAELLKKEISELNKIYKQQKK
jgi:hypothetical protein